MEVDSLDKSFDQILDVWEIHGDCIAHNARSFAPWCNIAYLLYLASSNADATLF